MPNFVNDASKMVVLRWIAFARGTLRPPNSFSHMDPFHADSMNDSVVCTSGSEEEGVVAVAVVGIHSLFVGGGSGSGSDDDDVLDLTYELEERCGHGGISGGGGRRRHFGRWNRSA